MSIIVETAAQRARLAGFRANLRVRGRIATVASQNEEDDGSEIALLVEDIPIMMDPDRPAQAQNPVYVIVASLAGSVDDPRSVTTFTEVATGKVRNVLEFLESDGDRIGWRWKCEAQREEF